MGRGTIELLPGIQMPDTPDMGEHMGRRIKVRCYTFIEETRPWPAIVLDDGSHLKPGSPAHDYVMEVWRRQGYR